MQQLTNRKYEWTRFWFIIIFGVVACMVFSVIFFIFSSAMSVPTSMKLILPKDADTTSQVSKTNSAAALTLLLGRNDAIYFYEGELAANGSNVEPTNYTNIKRIILDKKVHTNEKDFLSSLNHQKVRAIKTQLIFLTR